MAKDFVEQLTAQCASGMSAVFPRPFEAQLTAGARREIPITITDPSRCLRFIAVTKPEEKSEPSGTTSVRMEFLARDDQALGQSAGEGSFAVMPGGGPLCLEQPGQYRIVVHLPDAGGAVTVHALQATTKRSP